MNRQEKSTVKEIRDGKINALYAKAFEYVLSTKKLSFACLQRRFHTGLGATEIVYDRLVNDAGIMRNSAISIFPKPDILPKRKDCVEQMPGHAHGISILTGV